MEGNAPSLPWPSKRQNLGNEGAFPSNLSMRDPERKQPARQPLFEIGDRSPIVFLTVCSEKRKPIFARDDSVNVLRRAWAKADHWKVGQYVVLPDHIHLFCAPCRIETSDLRRWVRFWKSIASNEWPRPGEHPVWQIDCWDRQLRRGESYEEKWEYVRNNPVRHGHVARADDWPYQVELNVLEWHE